MTKRKIEKKIDAYTERAVIAKRNTFRYTKLYLLFS